MKDLIDCHKWYGVFYGMFNYSLKEYNEYWTYEDSIEFQIACLIYNL